MGLIARAQKPAAVDPQAETDPAAADTAATEAGAAQDTGADPNAGPATTPMVPDAGTADGSAPTDEGAQASAGENGTPQENKAAANGVDVASQMIYENRQARDAILKMVKAGGSTGAGQSAALVVQQVDKKLDLPETVILTVADFSVHAIVDLAQKANIAPADDKFMPRAIQAMLMELKKTYGFDTNTLRDRANRYPPPGLAQSLALHGTVAANV